MENKHAAARIRYQACPLCGGQDLSKVGTADCTGHPCYKPALPQTMTWLQCASCSHVFTDGYFSDDALAILFSETLESQRVGHDPMKQRAVSAQIIEKILPYTSSGDWLDIGFGNGSLLFTAHEYGFTPVGVDLRASSVDALRKTGIEAYCIDINRLSMPDRFGVVSMADVLEHMPYPVEGLQSVHALLKKDGMLFLSMPNADAVAWRFLNSQNANPYWGELEHYHNFGRKRLYQLLEDNGFKPLRYGISSRYIVCMEVVAQKIC
jgi:protein O-GlcNAc transferase